MTVSRIQIPVTVNNQVFDELGRSVDTSQRQPEGFDKLKGMFCMRLENAQCGFSAVEQPILSTIQIQTAYT